MTKPYYKAPTPIDQAEIIPFPTKPEVKQELNLELKLKAAMKTIEILENTTPKPEDGASPMGLFAVLQAIYSALNRGGASCQR